METQKTFLHGASSAFGTGGAAFFWAVPILFIALRLLQNTIASVIFCTYRVGIVYVFALLIFGVFIGRMSGERLKKYDLIPLAQFALFLLLTWKEIPWFGNVLLAGMFAGLFMARFGGAKRLWFAVGAAALGIVGYSLGARWFLSREVTIILGSAAGLVLAFSAVRHSRKLFWARFLLPLFLLPGGMFLYDCAIFPCGRFSPDLAEEAGFRLRAYNDTPLGRLYLYSDDRNQQVVCNVSGRRLKDTRDELQLRRAVLPALLQNRRTDLSVLYIGYSPSHIPGLLTGLPQVKKLDPTSFSGAFERNSRIPFPSEALEDEESFYDLIFVAELPPVDKVSRLVFVNELKSHLKPVNGVLVIPSQYIDTGIAVEYLPGTSKRMSVYSRGTPVIDWSMLEETLNEINSELGGDVLDMSVLAELEKADGILDEPPRSSQPSLEFFRSTQPPSVWIRYLTIAGVCYLLVRLFFGRLGRGYYFFAAAENGFALALVVLSSVGMLSHFRLVNTNFAPALLLFTGLAMWKVNNGFLQRFLKLAFFFTIAYLGISQLYVTVNPEWTLLILLPLAAAGSGEAEANIAQKGRLTLFADAFLMLAGALVGTALYAWAEVNDFDERLLYFALLLRGLYTIRL